MVSENSFYRSYLYVPGSKPEIVEKAFNSKADCIVIDLEDAVHHDKKAEARKFVAEFLATPQKKPYLVRINDLTGQWGAADLEAISSPNLLGIRLPKVSSIETVKIASKILDRKKSQAQIHLLIESALGIANLNLLANCDSRVAAISLGEADLRSDLRATDEEALVYAKSALVVACRAAGLRQPSQSVYTNIKDLDGLRESTMKGKAFGFFGRSVIHPNQIEIVNEVFTPTLAEYEKAKDLLDWYENMQKSGESVMALPNGDMIDPANIHYAKFQVAQFRSSI
tara:strand:+ start:922 stop:1770 length:849 start_codon:yes stop_codon:yes gene_type:complete